MKPILFVSAAILLSIANVIIVQKYGIPVHVVLPIEIIYFGFGYLVNN
jgi:hypothetical protein